MATFPYSGFLDGVAYPAIGSGGTTVNVASSSALTTALANAAPGQRIVLANGTYSGAFTLASKAGTATAPISVEAATTGGAIFASGSTFSITGSSAYVTVRGLSFPFELTSGNTVQLRDAAHHCRITRCLFGPAAVGTPGANKTPYIFMSGSIEHVRIDHNELRNKANPGNAILGDGNFTTNQAVKHIRIDHNYIHDIRPEVDNEKEPIRLGVSTMSKTMSYSVIERNVFVGCICEPEVISVKCGGVRVTGNTILRSIGGPVYRHGTGGVMTDNYVIDRVATFGTTIGSGGFRFYDANHEVSYNYVDGVYGGNFQNALTLDSGDAEGSATDLAAHWRVVNALVERNVLVGNPTGIVFGHNYSLAPTGCTVRDNLVASATSGTAVTQKVTPVSTTQAGNLYGSTPGAVGLAQTSDTIWRRSGYGPRLTYLQPADVGIAGDGTDSDGTGTLVGTGTTPDPGGTAAPVGGPSGVTWAPLFSEEFEQTNAAALLGNGKWTSGWFSQGGARKVTLPVNSAETAIYDESLIEVTGGQLRLHMQPNSTGKTAYDGSTKPNLGSRIVTASAQGASPGFQMSYGYVEARIQQPAGSSAERLWPDWWLNGAIHPEDMEIDVLEGDGTDTGSSFNIHWGTDASPIDLNGTDRDVTLPGATSGFHTYAADITPTGIVFYYDGAEVGRYTGTVPDRQRYLLLGATTQGTLTTRKTMVVDYVRAWTRQTTPGGQGTTAAERHAWGAPLSVSDEFGYTGTPNSSKWSLYNGPGHAGNGQRLPARVTVDGSKLVGTGLANGDSFGMAHRFNQQYGRWEVRARSFMTGGAPAAPSAWTAQVFVSPTGDDANSGTSASSPKRTIGAALSVAQPGQTISVAAGTYTGNLVTSKGGTAGNFITIRSATKYGAIISGNGDTSNESAVEINHAYVRIQDFAITGTSSSGVRNGVVINADNVEILGCDIFNICQFLTGGTSWLGGAGIDVWKATTANILIDSNRIHHIGLASSTEQLVHGIYCATHGTNFRITNNLIYRCEDFGVHPYDETETSGIQIINNTVVGTGRGILQGPNGTTRNNIVYNLKNNGSRYDLRGSGQVSSNNIAGGTGTTVTSTGVTVTDPLLVNGNPDSASFDAQLRTGSPALNAGTATGAPGADFAGTSRPQGAAVDIGAFEAVASMTSNGNDYHPVLIIWPESDNWPEDGEYDFVENSVPGDTKLGAYIHFPHNADVAVQQRYFERAGVDMSAWHNFAIEWTPDWIKGFLDGEEWFVTSGGANADRRNIQDMPSGHLTIQLDNFDGTNQTPATMEVDWVRVYTLSPVANPTSSQTVSATGIATGERFGLPAVSVPDAPSQPPPSNSVPTRLGQNLILGSGTLTWTLTGAPPDPAGPLTVTAAGGIGSAQAFGRPVLTVPDGEQFVAPAGIDSGAAYGRPTVTGGQAPLPAPGGVLVPALFAVGADGTTLTPLPAWVKMHLSPVRNSAGSLSIDYPYGAPGFDLLAGSVSASPLRACEIRIWIGGNNTAALGGWLVQKSGDDLSPGAIWTFSGHFHEWLLSKAIVAPQEISEANKSGALSFAGATAGLILATAMDQAQARGALPLVTRDFTTTHDSAGQPWAKAISSVKFAPKTTIAQIADKLVELGMCEYELTPGRMFRVFNPEGAGTDRSTGLNPLSFAHTQNLKERARRESSRDAGTAVLVAGSEGFYSWASSATAQAQLGWRAEVGVDAGQLNSQTAVSAVAPTYLDATSSGVAEYSAGVVFTAGQLPLIDYGIGDWALVRTGTRYERQRIAQIELDFEPGAPPQGTVEFNDLITDKVTALYRRLNAISTGDAVVGTSESTPGGAGEDHIPPAAPRGLTVASTEAYQQPGESETYALVIAGWEPVTTNAYADAETADRATAAGLIADRLDGKSSTESSNQNKATAASLIYDRLRSDSAIFEDWTWSGMPAVVGTYNDALLAEFEQAKPKAYAAQIIHGRLRNSQQIFEDWTWSGMPAVVGTHNDALLDEFQAANGSTSAVGATAQSWLQNYVVSAMTSWLGSYSGASGGAIFEDWTWSGMPAVVGTYNDPLLEEWKTAPANPGGDGNTFSTQARDWLLDYATTHEGGGVITDDVDHYRVQWRYLGAQVVPSRQDPGNGVPGEPTPPRDPNAFPDDAAWFEPGESPTTTNRIEFGGVLAGRAIHVRVCAVDRSGNQGPWCAPVGVVTAIDNQPPPAPSRPIASAWFRTMDITWDGKGSSGEDMFAAAPDVAGGGGVEVHVDTGIDFTPHRPVNAAGQIDASTSRTYRATLYTAGTWNETNLAIGTTYYARLVAVDRSGNASEPSETSNGVLPQQLVNIDIGPNAIARAQIIDGEIVRAKIADLAVNDAKIETISVGKLTAGTMTAQVAVSGRFSTPVSATGHQVQFDAAGLRMLRGGTVIGRWETFDGSMLITGQVNSAVTGQRIVMNPGGGNPDTMRFYPTNTDVYSSIDAVDFAGGTLAGIRIVGSGTTTTANRGMVLVRDQYASLVHGRTDLSYWGSEIWVEQNFTRNKSATVDLIVDERLASLSGPRRVAMIHYNSAGQPINATGLYYTKTAFNGGEPQLYANGQDCALVFAPDGLKIRNNPNGDWRDIWYANAHQMSGRATKRGIRDLDPGLDVDPLAVLRAVGAKRYRLLRDADDAPERMGFIAEDMPRPVRVTSVSPATEEEVSDVVSEAIDYSALTTLLWAATQQIERRVSALEVRDDREGGR